MEKSNIVSLTESQLNNVIKNTIKEIRENEKRPINENWFIDMSMALGDFIYQKTPQLFEQILKMHDAWKYGYDLNDPAILQKAKETVGAVCSVGAGVGGFAAATGVGALLQKFAPKIDSLKAAFFGQMSKG